MENINKISETGIKKEEGGDNLDWNRSIKETKSELKSIFETLETTLDKIKVMTEIAKDRNFAMSAEYQKKTEEVLYKFEPSGEYVSILYKMIGELTSINSIAFTEGLLVTAPELKQKLDEINTREKDK